jgi:hypothetical protein
MDDDAYVKEQRELAWENACSPNAWIERQAELRDDATIDPEAIDGIIRREQARLLARRAQEAQYFKSVRQSPGMER